MEKRDSDQFDDWCDKWAKAQEDGIFKDAPKPAKPAMDADFFGQYPTLDSKKGLDAVDAEYWNQVYKMSKGGPDPLAGEHDGLDGDGEGLVMEDEKHGNPAYPWKTVQPDLDTPNSKEGIDKKAKMMANDPNPQYAQAYGQDGVGEKSGRTRVSGGWAADERIKELNDLKLSLYELETKMSTAEGFSEKKANDLQGKMRSIKKQIDEISNSMPGNWAGNHEY